MNGDKKWTNLDKKLKIVVVLTIPGSERSKKFQSVGVGINFNRNGTNISRRRLVCVLT